jgi:hypothetical protein
MSEQSIGALAAKIVNPWAWYQAALKNPAAIGKTLLIHEDEPQQGYYRAKNRDKAFEPVGIFYPEDSDQLVAYRNGKEVIPDTIWTFACRHPVTYQAYLDALEGKGWPDDDKVVAAQIASPAPEPTVGDNSGEVSETETIADQIEAALAGMKAYETITDDKTAGKALSLRNRLNELSRDADKIRTREKEPHLEAGKAVDAKWQPLVKKAKAGADTVRDAIGAWETVKLQQRRAEEKRVEDERRAEEARLAALRPADAPDGETAVMEAPKVEVQPDVAPSTVRASYGKAASVSAKTVVDEVKDWTELAVYMSSHKEAQDLLLNLAQRAIDAGRTVPGITTKEIAAVR